MIVCYGQFRPVSLLKSALLRFVCFPSPAPPLDKPPCHVPPLNPFQLHEAITAPAITGLHKSFGL